MPAKSARRARTPAPATGDPAAGERRVRAALQRHGLLPMAGSSLPSVTTLVADAPVAGSWWGHPAGRAIYAVACRLADDPDTPLVKLLDGKDTWLHRRLVPALLAEGRSGEPWQTRGLSPAARALRSRLLRAGELPATGAAARELQQRLLAVGEQVHTASGRHEMRLRTWDRWAADRTGLAPATTPAAARRLLEAAARSLGGAPAVALLPWHAQAAAPRSQSPSTPRAGRRAARR